MNDYFSNLLDRSFGLQGDTPVVMPRLPSMFEPLCKEFAEATNVRTHPDDYLSDTQDFKTLGRRKPFAEKASGQQTVGSLSTLTHETYDTTNSNKATQHQVSTAATSEESPSENVLLTENQNAIPFSTKIIVLPQVSGNGNKSLHSIDLTSDLHTNSAAADKAGHKSGFNPQKFRSDTAIKDDLAMCQKSKNEPDDQYVHLRAIDSPSMRQNTAPENIELSRRSIETDLSDHERTFFPETVVRPNAESDALFSYTDKKAPNDFSVVKQSPTEFSFVRPRMPITTPNSKELCINSISIPLNDTENRPSTPSSVSFKGTHGTPVEANPKIRAYKQSKHNADTFYPVATNLLYTGSSPLSRKNDVRIPGRPQSNEPSVHVTIGLIEVRAVPDQHTEKKSLNRSKQSSGLQEYLKRRHGGES